ncbi:hypothetical protein [Telmatospirillum sp.]|uniref:hypothetical protein n=1 Tax=Telmatospirillum sp. TaxID=2079197 RepID=UPI00284C9186|nr:hypothetical protein [Telmatospirillum sp.]MDR3436432.1 hypothetical protein [Telmatospirillum sp.]
MNLKRTVLEAIRAQMANKLDRLKEIAKEAAQAEADLIFKVIAENFMGQSIPPALEEFTQSWEPLTRHYMKRKGNALFFEKSNELRNELAGVNPSDTLGATDRRWKQTNDQETAGDTYKIFVYPYHQYMLTHPMGDRDTPFDLDRLVGEKMTRGYAKLTNDQHLTYDVHSGNTSGRAPYRDVMLPSLLYFMKYRIPAAISKALGES